MAVVRWYFDRSRSQEGRRRPSSCTSYVVCLRIDGDEILGLQWHSLGALYLVALAVEELCQTLLCLDGFFFCVLECSLAILAVGVKVAV